MKVYQLLAHGRWFSLGTPASSTTKTGCHDIAEIFLKVALNTINHIKCISEFYYNRKVIFEYKKKRKICILDIKKNVNASDLIFTGCKCHALLFFVNLKVHVEHL